MRNFLRSIVLALVAFLSLPAFAANNGTITGTVTFSAGKYGNAASGFSGSNGIVLPNAFSTLSTYSIDVLLKLPAAPVGIQVAVVLGGNAAIWAGVATNGHFIGFPGFGSGSGSDSGLAISDNAWHRCVMVVTPTSASFYVDGTAGATFSGSGGTTSGVAANSPGAGTGKIGALDNAGSFSWLSGQIDQVAIWDHAQTNSTMAQVLPSASGLVSLYTLDSDASDAVVTVSTVTIDPSNAAVIYSPYLWSVGSGFAKTSNSNAAFRTGFTGTSVSLAYNGGFTVSPYPEVWTRIDGQPWVQFTLTASTTGTLAVASGLANRNHLLEVHVKSTTLGAERWGNPLIYTTGIIIDAGSTVFAPIARSKHVLMYGDSITEGFRAINNTAANDTDQSDSLGSNARLLETGLDAEVGIVAFSGQGVLVAGNGDVPQANVIYNQIYAGVSRDFTTQPPDLILINHGSNDYASNASASAFQAGYVAWLNNLLAVAPTAKIGVIVPFHQYYASTFPAIIAAVNNPRVTLIPTAGWWPTAGTSGPDSSDGSHPYNEVNLAIIGPKLLKAANGLLTPTGRSTSFF